MDPLERTFGYSASDELCFEMDLVKRDEMYMKERRLIRNLGLATGILIGGIVLGEFIGVYDIYVSGKFPTGGIVIEWDQNGKRDFLDRLDKESFER